MMLSIIVQGTPGNLANKAKTLLAVPHPVGQTTSQTNTALLIVPTLGKPKELCYCLMTEE